MKIQAPKGTFDILPYGCGEETWRQSGLWQYVEAIIRQAASEYGYLEIRTPIYERTELFDRGVGETTDIVSKEMFTFKDRSERLMSLRPEGTASTARAFVEHNLSLHGSAHKFFYIGPMFRYERPQSGRYRQHHQFGVEAYGPGGPEQDAEVIDLLLYVYRWLGLKNLTVHINSVGDADSRAKYRDALVQYLKPHVSSLSEESQVRFEKNPLRILDSKDPKDKELVQHAPSILKYLTPEAEKHFHAVCHLLGKLGIDYVVNDKIVRGLDYYNQTVFEVLTNDLGAQNTIGAGGRYDGLVAQFDGPDIPAVGFATGLERVLQVMMAQQTPWNAPAGPFVYFIPLGDEAKETCFLLAAQCRKAHIPASVELMAKKVGPAIQNAVRAGAVHCCVIGIDEMAKGRAVLKELATRQESEISLEIAELERLYARRTD